MTINNNMSSLYSSRQVGLNEESLKKSMERLSSGQRINRSADDASGLSISEKLRTQIRGLNQSGKNIQNGISFIQTSEGYMNSTSDILQRIRELAVQASNGIYSDEDREMVNTEVSSLISEIDRISQSAQFNGKNLLDGTFAEDGLRLHIGANTDQSVTINVANCSAEALGLSGQGNVLNVSDVDSANTAIGTIDEALRTLNKNRADLGAMQNRMEMALNGNNIAMENMTASESTIRDTNIATESVEFMKNQVLTNAASSMLAQSLNLNRDNVLRLLS